MDFGLSNRVVVITGASRGFGSAFADHFAQEGASLGLLARNKNELVELAKRLPTEAVPVGCDVTDEEQVAAAFFKIADSFGRIDSVVVNAGGQSVAQRANELPVAAWRDIVELNLTAPFITARLAYNHLRNSRAGRIVFVSSGAVKLPQSGSCAYISSKSGLDGLTKALCVEWANDNICVNTVMSGLIDYGAGREIAAKVRERVIDRTALRKAGRPADIANMVLYLSGDASEFVTGQSLSVDGGLGLR